MSEFKKSLKYILFITLFVVAIILVGNIIVVAEKIANIVHISWMEYVVYGLILIALLVYVVMPFVKVVKMPILYDEKHVEDLPQDKLDGIAKTLAETYQNNDKDLFIDRVKEYTGSQYNNQKELVKTEIDRRISIVDKTIKDFSLNVFLMTAISQNSRFDTVSVLVMNFRMIYKIIRSTGFRPNTVQLVKLYWYVMSTGLFAYVSSEVLDESVFVDLGAELGSKLGCDFISGLAGKVMGSVVDGSVNTLLTLRLGYITKKYLQNGFEKYKEQSSKITIYRDSIKEAFKASTDIPKLAFGKLGKNFI